MRLSRSKTMATVIALFLALSIAVTLVALPTANAHTPAWTIPTYAYLAIAPNPVGVGESVYVVMWIHGAPPTALGKAGDRWRDFTLTITKPNGDTETLGPWNSDPTGSTFTSYTPDQVGTYKFVFNYPGQVLTMVNPDTGVAADPTDPFLVMFGGANYVNDTFLASNATTYLTVQQEPIAKIPDTPLPTEYWTRPIEGQNSAWASVASNWLQGAQLGQAFVGAGANLWQRDGVAPGSAHIMWTKPIEFGGIVGGTTAIPEVGFYSGGSYEGRLENAIIMQGRLYYNVPLGSASGGGGYRCLDLRTGEEIWYRDDVGSYVTWTTGTTTIASPSFGQLFDYESMNQHGVVGGMLWQTSTEAGVTTWIAYDAFTGKWLFNETNIPSGTEVYTTKGEIVHYVLNYDTTTRSGWLALWNNTQDNVGLEREIGTTTGAYEWRPNGKTVDMSNAYSWNVTITADLSGVSPPSIVKVLPGDLILGTSTPFSISAGVIAKTPNPITMWAISDKPATRGQLLWVKNYTPASDWITPTLGPVDSENRVFTMSYAQTFQWLGYSLDDGSLLWGPVGTDFRAFQYYGSGLGGGQIGFAAYGNIYTQGFGGEIHCYSAKNGSLLWKYNNTNSGDETVWGNYPIFIGAIADGKVYAFNNEHSPNYPLYKGERVRCINATTGEEIWTLMGWSGQYGGLGASTMVEADGFLVYYNYYDNQIYSIGKGPSATTVTAPDAAITLGQSVVIKGTVTDQSAGAKKLVQDGEFSVVPAMSDESMGPWMEYLYMQKPIPTDATGVTVTLDVLDANGNYRSIGTATTDMSGAFSYMWEPDIPGKYTLIATFAGSESYYASYAETAFGVTEAPSATPAPQYPIPIDYTLPIVGATIVLLIAIAIAVVLLLRKK
jgi:outer membrane protein assembly factor BamB